MAPGCYSSRALPLTPVPSRGLPKGAAGVNCAVKTVVPRRRSHPTPPGPHLVLAFDKIVLLLGDHSSETPGNPRARGWVRHRARENNFLLALRVGHAWALSKLERSLSILFPGTVEGGGELGRKGVKLPWLTMSLPVSQHPSRPPCWGLTPLPGRSPQAVTGLQGPAGDKPGLGNKARALLLKKERTS